MKCKFCYYDECNCRRVGKHIVSLDRSYGISSVVYEINGRIRDGLTYLNILAEDKYKKFNDRYVTYNFYIHKKCGQLNIYFLNIPNCDYHFTYNDTCDRLNLIGEKEDDDHEYPILRAESFEGIGNHSGTCFGNYISISELIDICGHFLEF